MEGKIRAGLGEIREGEVDVGKGVGQAQKQYPHSLHINLVTCRVHTMQMFLVVHFERPTSSSPLEE